MINNELEYDLELKKKNAKKACVHCKKSHRKCNDVRPCDNCIKFKKNCFDQPNLTRVSNNIHPMFTANQIDDDTHFKMSFHDLNENEAESHSIPRNKFQSMNHYSNDQMDPKESDQDMEENNNQIIPFENQINDPVEYFFIQQSNNPKLLENLLIKQSMFITASFTDNINPNQYNSNNLIIQNISESACNSLGLNPIQVIGKKMDLYTPTYSKETLNNSALVIKKKIKKVLKNKLFSDHLTLL